MQKSMPYFTDDQSLVRFVQEELLREKYCAICGKPKQRSRMFKLKVNEEKKQVCFECFMKRKLRFEQVRIS